MNLKLCCSSSPFLTCAFLSLADKGYGPRGPGQRVGGGSPCVHVQGSSSGRGAPLQDLPLKGPPVEGLGGD